jgi:hypothetical protein
MAVAAVRSAVHDNSKVAVQAAAQTGATMSGNALILNSLGFGLPVPVMRGGSMFTPSGNQFPSTSIPSTKSHTEFPCDGILTYNAMNYVLAALFGNVTITTSSTAPHHTGTDNSGKQRLFKMANGLVISRALLTIETGASDRAKKVIDAFAQGLTIPFSDMEQSFSMPFIGGARQDDATPTTNATPLVPKIVNPGGFDVYVGDTQAALDTNENTGAAARFPLPVGATLTIPPLVQPNYRMNSSDTSYNNLSDVAGVPTLSFETGDSDGDFATLIGLLTTGATKFFRIVALGDAIEAGATDSRERWALDFSGKLISGEKPGEKDGMRTNTFEFQGVHDPTWGNVLQIETISSLAAFTGS